MSGIVGGSNGLKHCVRSAPVCSWMRNFICSATVLDPELTGAEFRVLAVLANLADEQGGIEVSQRELAASLGISYATIRRAMAGLSSKGFVSTTQRFHFTGTQTTNHFQIILERVMESNANNEGSSLGRAS